MNLVLGRRLLSSLAYFERCAEVIIEEEQVKPSPDTHLISFACEAIRLAREHTDSMARPIPSASGAGEQR